MGGHVVQKYLESHGAPTGVLLAFAPSRRCARLLRSLIRRHPVCMAHTLCTNQARMPNQGAYECAIRYATRRAYKTAHSARNFLYPTAECSSP